jgi:Uma2 family endonuclease
MSAPALAAPPRKPQAAARSRPSVRPSAGVLYPVEPDGSLRTPYLPPDGEPVWALETQGIDPLDWPLQGDWIEDDLLRLDPPGIELVDGRLRWKAMSDLIHNKIIFYLCQILYEVVEKPEKGAFSFATFKVGPFRRTKRVPDIVTMLSTNPAYDPENVGSWRTADLVIEVVSESDVDNDYVVKRREYAAAGVGEYWIVDRYRRTILQLRLDSGSYAEVGTFGEDTTVTSAVVPTLEVKVADVFAAAGLPAVDPFK